MVVLHLTDQEKLQVVLLAFALFSGALLTAICLAGSCCPLNKWLLERANKRRRQMIQNAQAAGQQQPPAYVFSGAHAHAHLMGIKGAPPGPPPAYEAALRVTRLQSLTGNLPPLTGCWPEPEKTRPLDFGDYFHQPRESNSELQDQAPQVESPEEPSPVLLRLWVRLMEPGELIARARGQQQSGEQSESSSSRLSRQLSIPQLFGSLVTLARQRSHSQETLASEQRPHESTNQSPDSVFSSTDSSSGCGSLPPTVNKLEGPVETKPESGHTQSATLRASPVTSRVLHMNVASFSYVKDEALISTKRHNQMNFHHFHSKQVAEQKFGNSKVCQLVISICDIENLLSACRLAERSCTLLSASSAIYIQCEILANKSKAGRLLSYPLRALNKQQSRASSSHTLNFSSSIPAVAMERHTVISVPSPIVTPSEEQQPDTAKEVREASKATSSTGVWKHEPSADGKSIVVFSSVPKQVAQQQQAPPELAQSDMIQFDSVFVSPILSKATIGEAHLRLRVFSQCKYVNESCLAELKLPLKRLLESETRDNLSDAAPELHGAKRQQQADFILNNLLTNLVTAASGSPLSTLIERMSQEEREDGSTATGGEQTRSHSFRLPASLWRDRSELRATNSLGGSLYRLPSLKQRKEDEQEVERRLQAEQEQRVEQNYCRSLMVSHWLNYLLAPAYQCQQAEEARGELILGLSYLPTSNRVVFNVHRASISANSVAVSKQAMKSLRLQTSTCYLVRLFMVLGGRVLRRKQTPVSRKLEWDSQEPITFDLASVGVEQPSFVVALVSRSAGLASGSLENLRTCSCHSGAGALNAQSDGELEAAGDARRRHELSCAIYRAAELGERPSRDLVIGHLVLAEQIWRELRAKPRKQIVRQFKLV